MEIKGYKAFNNDMTNRYGKKFEEGKIYYSENTPKFGNNGNGFHFCERLEDTLRYFPAMEEKIKIARVTGLGEIVTENDEYYGFYDMHASSIISIDKILEREEIINMFLEDGRVESRIIRFIELFKLNEDEIRRFLDKKGDISGIIPAIEYYQLGDKSAYIRYYEDRNSDLNKQYLKLKDKKINNI